MSSFEQHGFAWQHDAEAVALPRWSSVKRLRTALEQVSASHFGATWQGLHSPEKGEAVAVTVDLGDRPLGFCLFEEGEALDVTVPLIRSYRPDNCHPVFVLAVLQRRYPLLTFAFDTEYGAPAHRTLLVAYNSFSLDAFIADITTMFPELTKQIAGALADLEQHEVEEKRKDEAYMKSLEEAAETGYRLHKAIVQRRPEWMSDDAAYAEYRRRHGYLLHEPDYARLSIDEASLEKYLVVRDTVAKRTLLVRKLETDRDGIRYAYENALSVFGCAEPYDITVLYGTSWEVTCEAHPEYADGDPHLLPPVKRIPEDDEGLYL